MRTGYEVDPPFTVEMLAHDEFMAFKHLVDKVRCGRNEASYECGDGEKTKHDKHKPKPLLEERHCGMGHELSREADHSCVGYKREDAECLVNERASVRERLYVRERERECENTV